MNFTRKVANCLLKRVKSPSAEFTLTISADYFQKFTPLEDPRVVYITECAKTPGNFIPAV